MNKLIAKSVLLSLLISTPILSFAAIMEVTADITGNFQGTSGNFALGSGKLKWVFNTQKTNDVKTHISINYGNEEFKTSNGSGSLYLNIEDKTAQNPQCNGCENDLYHIGSTHTFGKYRLINHGYAVSPFDFISGTSNEQELYLPNIGAGTESNVFIEYEKWNDSTKSYDRLFRSERAGTYFVNLRARRVNVTEPRIYALITLSIALLFVIRRKRYISSFLSTKAS